jgi:hypothetical protein
MLRRALGMLVVVSMAGCAGAAAGAVANAAVNTAIAGTVSGVRRANGDCYTVCNPGSACNRSTGMCDPLPCGGRCNFDEKCESTYLGDKCVSAKTLPPVTSP